MIINFQNIKRKNILIMDLEFDEMNLLQAAGMIFTLINEKNFTYKLETSFNFYIKRDKVGKYARKYTGIDPQFLNDNGIALADFLEQFNDLMLSMDLEDALFVSHGSKNDRIVLKHAGVENLPSHSFCTHKNAGKILKREKGLALVDIARLAGYSMPHAHNAYYDVLATVVVFSFLQNKEAE
jgi:DNA polymerase III epsilon subunit-like protein